MVHTSTNPHLKNLLPSFYLDNSVGFSHHPHWIYYFFSSLFWILIVDNIELVFIWIFWLRLFWGFIYCYYSSYRDVEISLQKVKLFFFCNIHANQSNYFFPIKMLVLIGAMGLGVGSWWLWWWRLGLRKLRMRNKGLDWM